MELTKNETTVLEALRDNAESWYHEDEKFAVVYLDNASGDLNITGAQFAGTLASLTKKGLYRETNGESFFGQVKMDGRWND